MATRQRLPAAADDAADPWDGIDVPITHAGERIVLPRDPVEMDLGSAITTLQRKHAEAEQVVTINESIDAFPKDGAVAFQRAMQKMFGWTTAVPTPTFFGSKPPDTMDVEIGFNQRMSVVWGRFELPGIEGYVQCSGQETNKGPRFVISGMVKRKHFHIIRDLAELTRQFVAEQSIYRGKAIVLTVGDDGDIDWDEGVAFMDLDRIDTSELVFSAATERQIATSLWTPIEHTELCRKHRIPLKRGILMEGKYGTGKTLTSTVTAIKARENGWTFITINRVSGLDDALHFARKYMPAVIFAEDIDRIVSGEDRSVEIDDVLNTIDGIGSKNTEVIVVLTTNHIERINRAMLRPGRLDAIISVLPPDEEAARKLVRIYGRSLVSADDPLHVCAEKLAGSIPAMIRECVERAKLYAIQRAGSDTSAKLSVTDSDIAAAADGMAAHMALLDEPVVETKEPTLRDIIEAALQGSLERLVVADHSILQGVQVVGRQMGRIAEVVTAQPRSGIDDDTKKRIVETHRAVTRR